MTRRLLRVLHTAEVHLASDAYGNAHEHAAHRERVRGLFRRIVDRALTDRVDLVLVAGDLFDHNRAHGFFYPDRQRPDRSSPIVAQEIRDTGWDYVALGHQHVQTDVSQGKVTAYYAGAPEATVLRIDFSAEDGIRVEPRPLF